MQCLPQPKLTAYNEEAARVSRLQSENDQLKSKLARLTAAAAGDNSHDSTTSTSVMLTADNLPPGLDLVDEFYLIPG